MKTVASFATVTRAYARWISLLPAQYRPLVRAFVDSSGAAGRRLGYELFEGDDARASEALLAAVLASEGKDRRACVMSKCHRPATVTVKGTGCLCSYHLCPFDVIVDDVAA